MPAYESSSYDPPAPVARVALRAIGVQSPLREVQLLIDTGADITLLPRSAVEYLGLQPLSGVGYELIGFDGTKSRADAVELDMIFLRKVYRGRYLLTDEDRGVLRRDVMANVALLFDGPRQEWSEHVS